jgi:hypothetical protein
VASRGRRRSQNGATGRRSLAASGRLLVMCSVLYGHVTSGFQSANIPAGLFFQTQPCMR